MSKKIFLSLIISLIFVLCTSIGLGAWIIVNQITISPNFSNESVRKIITPKVIELDYTQEADENGNLLPVDWESFKTAITSSSKVICQTSTGTEVTLDAGTDITLSISAMNNGDIYYGTAVSGLIAGHTYVVGSTYTTTAQIISLASGYKLSSTNSSFNVLLKYKTAKIGFGTTTYYTVEDAIAKASSSDTITFDGVAVLESYTVTSGSNTTTHYKSIYSDTCRTSFTNLSSSDTGYTADNYTLKGKLRVPFANVDMDYHGSGGVTSIGGKTNGCEKTAVQAISTRDPATAVYSVLMIPENVTLNVATTGNFIVGGLVHAQGAVTNRGVVMNEGTININGNLGSYGYLKGSGTVNFNSGAKGIDVFRIYDWSGGGVGAALSQANVFPVNAYSIHNISCKAVINAGSSYEAFWTIAFDNTLYHGYQRGDKNDKLQDKDGNVKLIGKSGSSSLFELTSGSITKTANGGRGSTAGTLNGYLTSLTGSNATKGQMDIYSIKGNCSDNTISISITASGQSFDMETSTDIALPVGFMDVIVDDGGTLNIKSASYKFLPGSSLTIEDGGVLNVSNSATLAFCDVAYATQDARKFINQSVNDVDAFATINGELNIASGSSVGGKLLTVGNTGNLNISGNASASILITLSIDEGLLVDTANTDPYLIQSKGPVYNYNGNISNSELTSTNHPAKNSAWIAPNSRFNINYKFYDENGDEIEYTTTSNFTKGGTAITFASPPEGYKLNNWYWDEACTQIIDTSSLNGENMYERWIINNNLTVYGKCTEINENEVSIIINIANNTTLANAAIIELKDVGLDSNVITIDKTTYPDGYNLSTILSSLQANNSDIAKSSYFLGWFDANGNSINNTIDLTTAGESRTINVYGKWSDKIAIIVSPSNATVTLSDKNISSETTYYGKPDQEITYSISFSESNNRTYSVIGAKDGDVAANTTASSNISNQTFTVGTSAITISASSESSGGGGCFAEGTLITLADGSQKKVEDLTTDDLLLVFNHETGEYEAGKLWFMVHADIPASYVDVLNLQFSNGSLLRIVHEHGVFDITLNKYVYISIENVEEFIGHKFFTSELVNGKFVCGETTLISSYVTNEYSKVYSPITEKHLNCVADSMLTVTTSLFNMNEVVNVFEFGNNAIYDIEKMQADIEKYGLFTYEDLQNYISYETYVTSPIKYFNIAIAKDLITFEDLQLLINYLLENDMIT